ARLGGDEFAVLLETVHGRGDIVARRVEEALNGPVDVDGRLWPIAASVGLALVDDPHEPGESLLHRADAAMYEAKRARRRGAASGVAIAQPAAPIPPPPPADEPYPPADAHRLPVEEAAPRANGLIDKEALVHLDTLRGEIARVRESLQAIGKHLQIDYE
ncbi:MAG TPA: diguanylate cyclase, partial [Acidimicrobiales bacterium]|nr:diguanylate cyclase [Acidimicrobiales bacterium]